MPAIKPPAQPKRRIPKRFLLFQKDYPAVFKAYDELGSAFMDAGPLDAKQRALVKLGIAIGMKQEGTVHRHARRALQTGCTDEELRHAAPQAATTLGFPSMMAVMSWIDDVLG